MVNQQKQKQEEAPVALVGKKPAAYGSVINGQHGSGTSSGATGLPAVCLCILGVELCERLAFYTFTGTQEFFLERLGYSLSEAGGLNATMGTLCMAWALFAGWTADVIFGRYRTILVFGLLYALGAVIAACAAFPSVGSAKAYLVGVLLFVPIGTAGIKANISNFGADQYDTSDPAQAAAQEKFFSWFYLSINIGSAVAYGYLTTMGSNGGLGVPKSYGYFAVYAIAAGCMVLAVGLFCSGRAHYRMQPVQSRSALGGVAALVSAAARGGSRQAKIFSAGLFLLATGILLSVAQALMPEASFAGSFGGAAFACAAVGTAAVVFPCLDASWVTEAPTQEEALPATEVRSFLRLLPVLFTANLAFSTLYNSMQFWYQQQACQMDLRVPFGAPGAQFSGSFFMIADCLGIVVATPLAVGWLNPALERRLGPLFGHGAKFGLGMAFAGVSVLMATRFEIVRRTAPVLELSSNCAPNGVRMSAFSAAWMTVPFFLMGMGEIYTQPVLMHLAYRGSPPSMRTLAAATGLVISAVSTSLFSVQVEALSRYVPNDLNCGHLEYGYICNLLLAGVFYITHLRALRCFEEGEPTEVHSL
uniref:Uncharacterized protein n=1 Tax=Pyrodinium bahamense TaxID=73915 RepID=A0A7S0AG66_9DINO|mmetsp:Transcript_32903/g.90868  ORF Transcript_32903/g.90868 Transcript_32903/m.90868 type:complete len:589 (+) Transcript_32903:152-1918(+)